MNNPAQWFALMREQVKEHREASKDVLVMITTDEADNAIAMRHWYAGSLLAIDTLNAAEAYITWLLEQMTEQHKEMSEVKPVQADGAGLFPAGLPWSRCRGIALTFGSPAEE